MALVLGFVMLTGALVFVPGGSAAALPEDAWITGVVDDGTDPIPNVYVKAMIFMSGSIDAGYAFTDVNGEYTLGLPGGYDYVVIAANGSYYMSMETVSVDVGETATADLTLTPIAPDVADVTVRGFVSYQSGDPATGGHVLGITYDESGGDEDMPIYANVTTPDTEGYFEVNVLPSLGGGGAVAFDFADYPMSDNSSSSPIASGQIYWYNITLGYPPEVDDAAIHGHVADAGTGLPLEGALVSVEVSNEFYEGSYTNYTFTDASGDYRMDVMNGTADIWIMKGGYSMAMYNEEVIATGSDLQYDASLKALDCVVTGIVTDIMTHTPLEMARVLAMDKDGHMNFAITDGSGAYELESFSGEEVYIGAQMDGYYDRQVVMALEPGDEVLQDFELIPKDIQETVVVSGTVTDQGTDTPIKGARVRVAFPDMSYKNETTTDSSGQYEIYVVPLDGLPFSVTNQSYGPYFTDINCEAVTALIMDVELMPDPYRPNVTMLQDPSENISWTNPMTLDIEAEDHNMRQLLLLNFMSWYVEGFVDHMYLFAGTSVSFDPFEPASGLDYTQVGDTYFVDYVFDGSVDDDSMMGGWLENETDSVYLPANRQWWGPDMYLAFRAMYSNNTLTQEDGTAFFDPDTGEYLWFYFDGNSHPQANPDDPSGLLEFTVLHITLQPAPSLQWSWLGNDVLCESHVSDISFVPDALVPSGDCAVMFMAMDFGENGNFSVLPYSVDNGVPVADTGGDDVAGIDIEFTFDGSGSDDDVGITNYTWEFVDGSQVYLYGETPVYTFTALGDYEVTLTVTDGAGHTDVDVAVITVSDLTAPVAEAGEDQLNVPHGDEVTLDASASLDNIEVVSWTWTFDDGGDVTLEGETATHTFSAPGEFDITLTVADDAGNEDTDWVLVTVVDDEPPVADAGPDPEGVVAGETVILDGTDSTDNHLIVDYTWTFDDGGDVSLDGDVVYYTFTAEGEYEVTLTVTDASGNSDTDTVVVRVGPANEGPTADAGDDQLEDVVEGDAVTFDGGGSSDDVGIESFTWTFEYDGETQTLTGEVATFVFEIPGTYIVTLNVTDAEGEWDTDTMVVMVGEKASTFFTEYWWLLAVVAAVVVIAALVLLMKRSGGGSGKDDEGEEFEEEEELPPPDDE